MRVNGSYGDGECVMLDGIEKYVVTYKYVFSAYDLIIPSRSGDVYRININSYSITYINGVYYGRSDLPWVLNSPMDEIVSRDGRFYIRIHSKGSDYLDIMLVGYDGSSGDGDYATISLTQYSPTLPTLEIKVFHGR